MAVDPMFGSFQLPTAKTVSRPAIESSKTLVYGRPKIGKSTLARDVAGADATMFAATEAGQDELGVYAAQIDSWAHFRAFVQAVEQQNPRHVKVLVPDTVDELARMCVEWSIRELGGSAGQRVDQSYVHLSDFGFGKGYDFALAEFQLRIAALCRLGRGVIFISHEKTLTKNTRAGEIEVATPDMKPSSFKNWLEGFVDYIFYADVMTIEGVDHRVLRTQPTENYIAGGRVNEQRPPIPDPIPLTGAALRAALEASKGQTAVPLPAPAGAAQAPPQAPQTPVPAAVAR